MPVDSRRLQGPETSFCYTLLEKKNANEVESALSADLQKILIGSTKVRKDKRMPTDARQLFLKTGIISQAKGSAYIEQGNTKLVCGVYGPREVQKKSDFSLNGQLFCEFKFAPFSCQKRRGHQQDNEELVLSGILREALEAAVCLHKFPKAQVEVNVMVIENDGSPLAAALTCASLALASASIPMYDLVIGTSVRQIPKHFLLDPTKDEEWQPELNHDENNSNLTVGFMPSTHQVAAYVHEGVSKTEDLEQMLKLATEYCLKVQPVVQLCLKETVEKILSNEGEKVDE
ncbi:exosome complex component MTR3-like [Daphnia pulex]|uniref:exosome complex component MTR3-like n=1 Tax=Daphnia pulex TaxID=6669 RepID=UPI001EDE7551|nr:exosome complex component MTR3-like [Daphnia pulex]